MALTTGQTSASKGAALLADQQLPQAACLLAGRGHDAAWFRNALLHKGIRPCTPSRKCRTNPVDYDKTRYKQRHQVENMFGKIKDWRGIAMRYDRCAHTFFSAICTACSIIFINEPCA